MLTVCRFYKYTHAHCLQILQVLSCSLFADSTSTLVFIFQIPQMCKPNVKTNCQIVRIMANKHVQESMNHGPMTTVQNTVTSVQTHHVSEYTSR